MIMFLIIVIVCGLGTLGMWAISRHPELREHREIKMVASQPFLAALASLIAAIEANPYAVVFAMPLAAVCVIIVYLIWRDNINHLTGQGLISALFGDGRAGGGIRPELGFAQSLINDDNLKDAEIEITEQLRKDPTYFDGCRMLAAIYQEWKQPDKAIEQLNNALKNKELPESQLDFIKDAVKELKEQQRTLDAEKQRPG